MSRAGRGNPSRSVTPALAELERQFAIARAAFRRIERWDPRAADAFAAVMCRALDLALGAVTGPQSAEVQNARLGRTKRDLRARPRARAQRQPALSTEVQSTDTPPALSNQTVGEWSTWTR